MVGGDLTLVGSSALLDRKTSASQTPLGDWLVTDRTTPAFFRLLRNVSGFVLLGYQLLAKLISVRWLLHAIDADKPVL